MRRQKTSPKMDLPKGYPRKAAKPSHISLEERLNIMRLLRSKNQKHLYSLRQNLLLSILAFLCNRIIEIFHCTYRVQSFAIHPKAKELIENPEGQFIIALWHNRLFCLSYSIKEKIINHGNDILAMVSASRDGELTTRVNVNWGAYVVRGSSSRHGMKALREVLRYMRYHFQPLIIPDGPRGPCYQVKGGLPFLAKLSQVPVLPLCYAAKSRWIFHKSWDQFSIPKPFSKIAFEYGEPFYIPKNMGNKDACVLIEKKMMAQWYRTHALVGSQVDDALDRT